MPAAHVGNPPYFGFCNGNAVLASFPQPPSPANLQSESRSYRIDAAYSPNNPATYSSYLTQNGNTFYGIAYETNTLGADINSTTVTSIRNGDTSTNTTWQ
jgi:hypothetical protein